MTTTRYITTASHEPEITTTELLAYVHDRAPVGASAGQVRAIARLWETDLMHFRALADGDPEVDALRLLTEATEELAKAEAGTFGALALQALINWMLVGSGKVQEVQTI